MLSCACMQDGCYHCGFAHPGLSQALDLAGYHNVLYERVSFQLGPLSDASTRPNDGEWDDIIASRVEGEHTRPCACLFLTSINCPCMGLLASAVVKACQLSALSV